MSIKVVTGGHQHHANTIVPGFLSLYRGCDYRRLRKVDLPRCTAQPPRQYGLNPGEVKYTSIHDWCDLAPISMRNSHSPPSPGPSRFCLIKNEALLLLE